jgi:hypothetical protein
LATGSRTTRSGDWHHARRLTGRESIATSNHEVRVPTQSAFIPRTRHDIRPYAGVQRRDSICPFGGVPTTWRGGWSSADGSCGRRWPWLGVARGPFESRSRISAGPFPRNAADRRDAALIGNLGGARRHGVAARIAAPRERVRDGRGSGAGRMVASIRDRHPRVAGSTPNPLAASRG